MKLFGRSFCVISDAYIRRRSGIPSKFLIGCTSVNKLAEPIFLRETTDRKIQKKKGGEIRKRWLFSQVRAN